MGQMSKVAENVRRIREGLGMTQHDLAAASGLSRGGIQKIEGAIKSPTVTTLEALAGAMGVSIVEFFQEEPLAPIKSLLPVLGRPDVAPAIGEVRKTIAGQKPAEKHPAGTVDAFREGSAYEHDGKSAAPPEKNFGEEPGALNPNHDLSSAIVEQVITVLESRFERLVGSLPTAGDIAQSLWQEQKKDRQENEQEVAALRAKVKTLTSDSKELAEIRRAIPQAVIDYFLNNDIHWATACPALGMSERETRTAIEEAKRIAQ
jgi:transcriptional regulator with XRE-family HTH domain